MLAATKTILWHVQTRDAPDVEGQELDIIILLAGMQRVEIRVDDGDASRGFAGEQVADSELDLCDGKSSVTPAPKCGLYRGTLP